MLKKLSVLLAVVMIIGLAAVTVNAGSDDAAINGATLSVFKEIAPGDEGNALEMRGFTASPDGKYLYCGFLQGYRHVTKYDAATGDYIAEYEPLIENDDTVTEDNNYPKGFAVDCRGYLFVGITHANTDYISLACVDANMEEVSYITEDLGETTGINGVASQKIGDKIFVYVTTSYDKDTIRCYDVTDVNNMHLYEGFGNNGVIDYNDLLGSQNDPGYITVDADGYVYICYKKDGSSYSKGSTVVKLDTDGKTVVASEDHGGAYGICTAGDYLFVTTYESTDSCVYVLNKSDLTLVKTLVYADQIDNLSGIYYAGDYLYVGDHGDNSATCGIILRSSKLELTRDSKETETVVTEALTKPETTAAPETTAPDTTDAKVDETTAAASAEDSTAAPAETGDTAPNGTEAASSKDTTTSGKDSVSLSTTAIILIVVAVVVVAAIVVFIIVKSKKKK